MTCIFIVYMDFFDKKYRSFAVLKGSILPHQIYSVSGRDVALGTTCRKMFTAKMGVPSAWDGRTI